MTPRFPHSHGTTEPAVTPEATGYPVDWRASLRRADRACCCPGAPAVVVIMPPGPGRPYPVDLLLCCHHYRVSRRALAAAGAIVLNTDGTPLTEPTRPAVPARR